ncbi:hypothetical protein B0H13DRAFT_2568360 [Mycena leptocephala]|nr:hypothetical protein B0H13DRAFT_2568360 [Mycena leptocephala]
MSNAMDDDADDDLHLQSINHNASRDELVEALKASQLSVVKLLAENRQLRTENSNLLANSSKKRRNNGLNDNLLGYKSEVLRFAKHFLFTRALFVPIAAFQPNTIQTPEDPRNCFENNDTYTRSITSALYEDIPEKFHSLLEYQAYGNFGKDFIREHGDGRSALLGVIRKALPVILKGHGIDSGLLTNAKADRSKDAVIDRLLRFPAERKATLYPPILFPGSTRNMNEVFTGPIIMDHLKIHRLMYFGPSAYEFRVASVSVLGALDVGRVHYGGVLKLRESAVGCGAVDGTQGLPMHSPLSGGISRIFWQTSPNHWHNRETARLDGGAAWWPGYSQASCEENRPSTSQIEQELGKICTTLWS